MCRPSGSESRALHDAELEAYLSRKKRVDERTRTTNLVSLRACGQWLLGVAGVCKFRISKRSFVPSIARYCVRVRVKLGSSGVWTRELRYFRKGLAIELLCSSLGNADR